MARQFEPVQLGSIEIFCRAAESGSFTSAAQAVGVTPAAVSRSIGRLEQRLGVRLFNRTTRQVRLTDDGQLYFDQCRQALAQIEEAERALTGNQKKPQGLLRVSVPTTYGHHRVLPMLAGFRAAYPRVDVEINVSNRNVDFVEEGYDIAVRLGLPSDSRIVARTLEDATLGVFASPAYLKKHGTPKTLVDLNRHTCIPFVMPRTGKMLPWSFMEDGQPIEREVTAHVHVSDDVLGCVTLARHDAGLTQTYHFIVQEDLKAGRLVEVLKPYAGRSRPFVVLYPPNRHLSAKVRAFVDYLTRQVSGKRG